VNAYGLLLLLLLGLFIVAAILLFLPRRRSKDRVRVPADRPLPPCTAMMSATGWGWTVNFAHPGGKLFLAFTLLLFLLPVALPLLGVFSLLPLDAIPLDASPRDSKLYEGVSKSPLEKDSERIDCYAACSLKSTKRWYCHWRSCMTASSA
jgi:hypothetical protein